MNSIFFTSQHKTLTFKGGVGRFLAFLQASKLFVVQIYALNDGIQSSALSSLRCLQVVRVYSSYEKRVRFRCKSFKSQKSTTYWRRVQIWPHFGLLGGFRRTDEQNNYDDDECNPVEGTCTCILIVGFKRIKNNHQSLLFFLTCELNCEKLKSESSKWMML